MMMTPTRGSKPSISTSSWLSVCSRSSWPPMMAPPRDLPMASSSSIKMMQGAFSRAWVKSSRTRDAPTPTNISTNSEPEMEKKGTCASPATARASSVLPVPGGPIKRTPLGIWPPRRWKPFGCFQVVDDFDQFGLGLVAAGHVGKARVQVLFGSRPGPCSCRKAMTPAPGFSRCMSTVPDAEENQDGDDPGQDCRGRKWIRAGRGSWTSYLASSLDRS